MLMVFSSKAEQTPTRPFLELLNMPVADMLWQ
jgi:hypothetical protein